ncbi:hypothetical protein AAH979_17620 [Plantactinospora sp. ZYX-F-223]|uniref:DUF7674 family protein n=1 Tax=Plantactinospora sp. ZYX-F-223 TaxID=3144103 RepID=UPI0031FC6BBB
MASAEEFIRALVARFPALRPSYEEHLQDYGELLPHVVFGIGEGFTDRVVEAYMRDGADDALDWRSVLEFLDSYFDRGDREVDEVVVTDFLDALPGPKQRGYGLVEELPERLHLRFEQVRPYG